MTSPATPTAAPAAAVSRQDSLRAIEREVGVLLRRVRRVIGERARAVHPDLQPASYLLLTHLEERGTSRGSVVVEDLGIDKGAVSRQLTHLVDLGLIARERDPEDGRAMLLSLTDDARARLARVQVERSERFDRRLAEFSAADLASFVDLLGRYNAALD